MIQTRPAGANWSGNHRYRAAQTLLPADLDELATAISDAGSVRVQATRHTFNDVGDTDGALVSLERMPVAIDVAAEHVRVEGLVTFAQLAPVLEAEGRALHNLGSLPHISVAGATATGTHGSGVLNGNLSSAVTAVEIMDATGAIERFDRAHAWFPAAALSLGALGVVTAVELRTEPTYLVTAQVYTGISWEAIAGDPDRVLSCARSVSVFTTWGDPDDDLVWVKASDGDESDAVLRGLGGEALDGPLHLGRIRTVNNTTALGTAGPWHTRLPHFRADALPSDGDEIQSEYFVPLASAREALTAVRAVGCGPAARGRAAHRGIRRPVAPPRLRARRARRAFHVAQRHPGGAGGAPPRRSGSRPVRRATALGEGVHPVGVRCEGHAPASRRLLGGRPRGRSGRRLPQRLLGADARSLRAPASDRGFSERRTSSARDVKSRPRSGDPSGEGGGSSAGRARSSPAGSPRGGPEWTHPPTARKAPCLRSRRPRRAGSPSLPALSTSERRPRSARTSRSSSHPRSPAKRCGWRAPGRDCGGGSSTVAR